MTVTGKDFIQQIQAYSKYAKYLPEHQRRETIDETFERNRDMHLKKYPHLKEEIEANFELMKEGWFLPAMRSMQFAGDAIEKHNARIFNCSAFGIDHIKAFSEIMYLLLCGCGVGYSVRNYNISKLPNFSFGTGWETYVVEDSIEGWADAVHRIMEWAFEGQPMPMFDYSNIRPAGSRLSSGVIAPGPSKLQACLTSIVDLLWEAHKSGKKRMGSLLAHDIACYTADCVVSGGVRRSAMIVLFDWNDLDMLKCKVGNWWEKNAQRARANNSAGVETWQDEETQKMQTEFVMKYAKEALMTGSGDPAVIRIDSEEYLFNPCCKPLNSLILTESGYVTFKQALEMSALQVVTGSGTYTATRPFATGTKSITRITLSNGSYLYGTPDHRHKKVATRVRYDGGIRPNIKQTEWVPMSDLKVGDYLEHNLVNVHENMEVNMDDIHKGRVAGWIVGDGWVKPSESYGLCFGVSEADIVPYFEEILGVTAVPHAQKPDTCKVILLSKEESSRWYSLIGEDKFDVEYVRLQSPSFKLGWLQALFTADGTVRMREGVELFSINKDLLLFVQSLLNEFGLYSAISIHNNAKSYVASDGDVRNNQTCYKVCCPQGTFKRIGLLSQAKKDRLAPKDEILYRNNGYLRVTDIEENFSVEPVYDITVSSEDHAFIDSGITTHNCEALLNYNSCNLGEIVGRKIKTQEDFNRAAKACSFWCTMQAGYFDFKYLRPIWAERTALESLIGVGITGIVDGHVLDLDPAEAATIVKNENERVANLIGINPAHRTTVIKPGGNSTLFSKCYGSGCHDAFSTTSYIRRMRIGKTEPIYIWLMENVPNLMEDEAFDPTNTAVLSVPIRVVPGEVKHTTNGDPIAFLERVKFLYDNWIMPGHRQGPSTNNVSATCYVTPEQHEIVEEWMWNNRDHYKGISLLPTDNANYPQMPLEIVSDELIDELETYLVNFDPTQIVEAFDMVNFISEASCAGGQCELI